MKRIIRNSICAFIFALAFLFVGTTASAKELGAINNTNVSNYSSTFELGEQTFYVAEGNAQNATINLKYKEKGTTTLTGYKTYTAYVNVYRCSDFNEEDNICNTWRTYQYSANKNDTADALNPSKGGLKLTFKNSNFTSAKTQGSLNGFNFGSARSAYDMEKTYFVAVQYHLPKVLGEDRYTTEVFRVLLSDELEGVTISSLKDNTSGKTTVTVTSGLPISNVRYFSTTTQLAAGYNFNNEYSTNATATELVTEADKNPNKKFFLKLLGVFAFVSVPLPLTGVWTGTCVAVALGLGFGWTCLTVICGNVVAGLLITLASSLFGEATMTFVYILLAIALVVVSFSLIKKFIKKRKLNKEQEALVSNEETKNDVTKNK